MSIEGDLKLTDLGRAREALVTETKRYGTPLYRAPEIHFSPNTASETCDFWSLGVILYQMVVGKMPFTAANEHNLFKKIKSTAASCGIEDLELSQKCRDLLLGLIVY